MTNKIEALALILGLIGLCATAGAQEVVLSEIMYHPESGSPDEEYVELANISASSISLAGWQFTRGIGYEFPDVTIAPGAYLVVAANKAAFEATYQVTGALGDWTGSLSNRGERLTLEDASGEEVFDVTYSDEGDWADRVAETDPDILRGESGWKWEAPHDGLGASLELTSTALLAVTDEGQLWRASEGGPTPGATNSTAVGSFPPIITKVKHVPAVPTSSDMVTVSAKVVDIAGSALEVELFYRLSSMTPGAFLSVEMMDDGLHEDGAANDDVFGATLAAMSNGDLIEFYVSASDGSETRTWPAPTDTGQVANCHFQVDDEVHDESMSFYRLLMTVPDEDDYAGFEKTSNAQVNSTLIAYDCKETQVRYRCGTRIRGSSSRYSDVRPVRINIPHSKPLNGGTAMNLGPKKSYLQLVGQKLFQASGLPAVKAWRVQFRRNGVDLITDPTDKENFGSWVHLQPFGADFVDDFFPNDSNGNLYRNGSLDYREGMDYYNRGWKRQTNSRTNGYDDVHALMDVLVNEVGDADYLSRLEERANVDQWMEWLAVMGLFANSETNLSTGREDDYASYVGVNDPRLILLPHDLDSIITASDEEPATFTLIDSIENEDQSQPMVDLFALPEIRTRFYTAMRHLLNTSFSKSAFDSLVERELGEWVPLSERQDIIAWMDTRRAFATSEVDAALGAPPTVPQATANETFQSTPGTGLVISELLASNEVHPEFVELANHGSSALVIGGLRLTDNLDLPTKYIVPSGTTLAPGEYRTFLTADIGFSLDADGEELFLLASDGVSVIDQVSFGAQVLDLSISRTGAAHDVWALSSPTPGAANAVQPLGASSELRLNEWLTSTTTEYTDDFVEIYNGAVLPVALGGLVLDLDPWTKSAAYEFPELSFLAPQAWKVLVAGGSVGADKKLPYALSAEYGWLSLLGSNEVEIDEAHWSCQMADVSGGRLPDGASQTQLLPGVTPERANDDVMLDVLAIRDSLRVVAIHYDPLGGTEYEYVELSNVGTEAIELGGLRFSNGIDFSFPKMTLAPGERVFVAENRDQFETVHGVNLRLAGQYNGKLSNGGERLRLDLEPVGFRVMDFVYDDAWHPSTDGNGDHLKIVNPLAPPESWNSPGQWVAASRPITDPYALWVMGELGTTEVSTAGRLADPDGDQVGNLAEWGFALEPDVPNVDGLAEFVDVGVVSRFTYQRNTDAEGLAYVVEESTDLVRWSESVGASDVSTGTIGSVDYREVTTSHGSDDRVFLRVTVSSLAAP